MLGYLNQNYKLIIIPMVYFNVKYLEDNHRLLFTHDTELLKLSPKFVSYL
jgi:hypothetical protein